jgi:uncharacterized protein (DUF433 family)
MSTLSDTIGASRGINSLTRFWRGFSRGRPDRPLQKIIEVGQRKRSHLLPNLWRWGEACGVFALSLSPCPFLVVVHHGCDGKDDMDVAAVLRGVFSDNEMDKLLRADYRPGIDSREQALYTLKEAARYLGVRSKTLHTWFYGRNYQTKAGTKHWDRVLAPANAEWGLLSFFNLAEAHILAATRYEHDVPFPAIRSALENIATPSVPLSAHPLLSHDFYTNGKALFIKTLEETIDISHQQLSLKVVMDEFLERLIRDEDDTPFKVFPLVRGVASKVVSITAGVSSGRPTIEGYGVPVSVVWGRRHAGESAESIADDFDIPVDKINEAIKYFEWKAPTAA